MASRAVCRRARARRLPPYRGCARATRRLTMRGSLVQRYKGSWSVVLDLGYQVDPATGTRKRKQQWITIRGTRRDAENKLGKAVKPPARTLRAHETYKSVIDRHLKPKLGGIALQQLKAVDLKRYYDEHAQGDDALATATLEPHHTIAHSALQAAVLEGLVQRNV